jgi:hypothetical protein
MTSFDCLTTVMTIQEATEMWQLTRKTLSDAIRRGSSPISVLFGGLFANLFMDAYYQKPVFLW